MAKRSYEILGVNESASMQEIEQKYNELVNKYSKERFLEGEAGNIAAKKLTEVKSAYQDILDDRKENSFGEDGLYKSVYDAIKNGDIVLAQALLDKFNDRNAEWHYLQSVVFYRKNWNNESKKQLKIALELDPGNEKYKTAYDKLVAKMENPSQSQTTYSSGGEYSSGNVGEEPQMGGGSCFDFCCQLLICNTLLNCCCNCN